MIPPPFDYYTPSSLPEALSLLGEIGEDARVIAGGQSLIPMLKLRLIRPRVLVDLIKVKELSYIREAEKCIQIGTLTTERQLETSLLVKRFCPALSQASSYIADIHVRNLGTIGGSVCHADPAGDLAPTLLALGASLIIQSANGERIVRSDDFFVGPFATSLAENEILTGIEVPKLDEMTTGTYVKLARKAGDFAVVGASVVIGVDHRKRCQHSRVALCGVGPKPFLSIEASQALLASELSDSEITRASELAKKNADPVTDVHASAEYRREMIPVVVSKALRLAKQRLEVAQ